MKIHKDQPQSTSKWWDWFPKTFGNKSAVFKTSRIKGLKNLKSLDKRPVCEFGLWQNNFLNDYFCTRWSLLNEVMFYAKQKKDNINGIGKLHNSLTSRVLLFKYVLI